MDLYFTQAALGKKEETLKQWLKNKPFSDAPQLTHYLEVTDGWDKAVEHILGNRLQGFCVENFASFGNLDELTQSLPKGECIFINFSPSSSPFVSPQTHETLIPLSHKIKINESLNGIQPWFQHIYIAETLEHAQTLLSLIQDDESIITRDGAWLGKQWLRWVQGKQGHHGIIQREQAIKTLTQHIEKQKEIWETCKQVYENGLREIQIHETTREKLNEHVQVAHQKWMDHNAQIRIKKNQLDALQEKHKHIEKNVVDQQNALKQAITQKETLQKEWERLSEESKKNEHSREAWYQSREKLYTHYDTCRTNAQQAQANWHTSEIKLTRLKSEQESLQKNIVREQGNKLSLEKRLGDMAERLKQTQSVDKELAAQWEKISRHHATEAVAVENTNKTLKDLDEQLKKGDQTQQQLDTQITALQHQLEKKRLDAQTLKVKCENIEEAMAPLNTHPSEKILPDNVNIAEWESNIQTLNNKIQKLGPINLAALEEFKTESERKKHLDEQYQDLINALETLETAIKAIDEETRARFQETYQQINEAFQHLFPRLFGGGQATMTLTQADCLEAGVTIMAQPPGKRNSSIHLLSGGEKAMTAIALVFAIFQLNPSPFCLLDEVDAPLDDVNVGRFCSMVKEMSEQVQFIFITHNKVTMELATHLSGITMNEPGVSRLVTVDVDEAVSLVQ